MKERINYRPLIGSILISCVLLFSISLNLSFSSAQIPTTGVPAVKEASKTLTEIIMSNIPGILTGLAALITALASLLLNRKKIRKKDLPEEINKALQEEDFRKKLLLNLINKDMLETIIKNGNLVTTLKLETETVKKLEGLNEMVHTQTTLAELIRSDMNHMGELLRAEIKDLEKRMETMIRHERELRDKDIQHIEERIGGGRS